MLIWQALVLSYFYLQLRIACKASATLYRSYKYLWMWPNLNHARIYLKITERLWLLYSPHCTPWATVKVLVHAIWLRSTEDVLLALCLDARTLPSAWTNKTTYWPRNLDARGNVTQYMPKCSRTVLLTGQQCIYIKPHAQVLTGNSYLLVVSDNPPCS